MDIPAIGIKELIVGVCGMQCVLTMAAGVGWQLRGLRGIQGIGLIGFPSQ